MFDAGILSVIVGCFEGELIDCGTEQPNTSEEPHGIGSRREQDALDTLLAASRYILQLRLYSDRTA